MNLDEFIKDGMRKQYCINAWVEEPGFNGLYVRFGPRTIGREVYRNVLDLANAEVTEQRKGTMTNRIRKIREDYPNVTIFAENVMVYGFAQSLVRMGFHPLDNANQAVTAKLIGNQQFFCANLYWPVGQS